MIEKEEKKREKEKIQRKKFQESRIERERERGLMVSIVNDISVLASSLRLQQEKEKFESLEQLSLLFSSLSHRGREIAEFSRSSGDLWPEEIRDCIWLLLSSKIGEIQFGHVIYIASQLWNWFGHEWILGEYWRSHCKSQPLPASGSPILERERASLLDGDRHFKLPFMLLNFARLEVAVRLVSVVDSSSPDEELRSSGKRERSAAAHEAPSLSTLDPASRKIAHVSIVLSSFNIIENAIGLLVAQVSLEESGDGHLINPLSPNVVICFQQVFSDVFPAILDFIERMGSSTEPDGLVIAAVQLVGVWLQDDFHQPQETLEKVARIVPFVVRLQINVQSASGSLVYFIAPFLSGFSLILEEFSGIIKAVLCHCNGVKALTLLWRKSMIFMSQFDGPKTIALALSDLAQILAFLMDDGEFASEIVPLRKEIEFCLDLQHHQGEKEGHVDNDGERMEQ